MMPWKTDPAGNAGEPDFERGAQRVRKKDRNVEGFPAPQRPDDRK